MKTEKSMDYQYKKFSQQMPTAPVLAHFRQYPQMHHLLATATVTNRVLRNVITIVMVHVIVTAIVTVTAIVILVVTVITTVTHHVFLETNNVYQINRVNS
ncbi:hypothetical protein AB4254_11130 [Vibrio breoganii]